MLDKLRIGCQLPRDKYSNLKREAHIDQPISSPVTRTVLLSILAAEVMRLRNIIRGGR
jgi:hypothetical protein